MKVIWLKTAMKKGKKEEIVVATVTMIDQLTKDRGTMMKTTVKKTLNLHGSKEVNNGVIMVMLVHHKTTGMLMLLKILSKIRKKDGVLLALKLRITRNLVKMKDLEILVKVQLEDGVTETNILLKTEKF